MATLKSTSVHGAGTSLTALYTVPASTTVVVKEIFATNYSASTIQYRIVLVKSGGATTTLFPLTDLVANECNEISCTLFMEQNDVLQVASSTASALDVTMSYIVI